MRSFAALCGEFRLVSLILTCGELYDKRGIVGLNFRLVCRLISHYRAALITFVYDNVALFGIGLGFYRAENTAAVICSVTRVYIHVQRAKTEGAMVTRGIAEGQHLFAAILTHKAVVILGKSFVFHIVPFWYDFTFPRQNNNIFYKGEVL